MKFNQDYRSAIAALLANPESIASIGRYEVNPSNAEAISIAASVADCAIIDLCTSLSTFARIVQEWQQSPREKLISEEQALYALSLFAEMAGETIQEASHITSAASVAGHLYQQGGKHEN